MQNQLKEFENKEFGRIRVADVNGQLWWILKDVCKALGLTTPSRVAERLDEDEVSQTHVIDGMGREQNTYIITESGLYAVILRSNKPGAKAFRKWITSEILPSIRKHGAYVTDDTLRKMLNEDGFTDELISRLSDEKARTAALLGAVEALAPKARYYDIVLQCKNAVQTSIIAKDYGMTCAAFNKMLNRYGVQYKIGDTWLLYREYAGMGYTVTRTYYVADNYSKTHTYWTQRGRWFLYELLKAFGILPCAENPDGAMIGGGDDNCP